MIANDLLNKAFSKYGYIGNIITSAAKFASANDDYIATGIDLSDATAIDLTVKLYRGADGIVSVAAQFGSNTSKCGIFWYTDNKIYLLCANGANSYGYKLVYSAGWVTLRMVYDGSGAADADKLKLYIDDELQTLTYGADPIPASLGTIANEFYVGRYNQAMTIMMDGYASYLSISKNDGTASVYYLTGKGDYEYDVSTNGDHGEWGGTGDRYVYDDGSLSYLLTGGYSLWGHATEVNIQVPYGSDGSALSLTPGVDIPAGYTKTRDVDGSDSHCNMADGLIDFDPKETTNSKLDIFDRSNATIQTATSRASDYYDASNPYRYHVSEITNPVIYDTFFNTDYKNRAFAKIKLSGSTILKYLGQLNYVNKKTGANLASVLIYCGITSIYP